VEEIEATEMLLRAIMAQNDNRIRGKMIQNLCEKHSAQTIYDRINYLEQLGHPTAPLKKTLQIRRLQ
jgi:hypothetical protein